MSTTPKNLKTARYDWAMNILLIEISVSLLSILASSTDFGRAADFLRGAAVALFIGGGLMAIAYLRTEGGRR